MGQGKVIATAASNTADAVCGAYKQCACSNGTGASGTQCPVDGNIKCVSCNSGFRKEGLWCDKIPTTPPTSSGPIIPQYSQYLNFQSLPWRGHQLDPDLW